MERNLAIRRCARCQCTWVSYVGSTDVSKSPSSGVDDAPGTEIRADAVARS